MGSTVIDDQEKEEAPAKIHVSTSAMKGAWATLREGFQERGDFLELIGVIDDYLYHQSIVQNPLRFLYVSLAPKILAELLDEGSNLSTSSS